MKDVLRLLAVGDISLQTKNAGDPFPRIRDSIVDKDILIGNLETVLSNTGRKIEKAHSIHSTADKVVHLRSARFDVLSVANNHTLDLGGEGLANTMETLSSNGIRPIGARIGDCDGTSHAILEKNGTRVGFLAYTSGLLLFGKGVSVNRLIDKRTLSEIRSLKSQCDAVVVSVHWGTENVDYPSPAQIRLAREMISSGASLVLGHGPHVVQGLERYKQGVIAYSLGNFNFDPAISRSCTNDSIILAADLRKRSILNVEIIPVTINESLQPEMAQGTVRDRILSRISEISVPIEQGVISWPWWFERTADRYVEDSLNSYTHRIRNAGVKPLVEFGFWLVSPFHIRCQLALLRKRIRALVSNRVGED